MRRTGRVCVKRAFVVNTFYVRSLLYRSLSARVKCQKISDSLVVRARPPRFILWRASFSARLTRSGILIARERRDAVENGTSLLYNFSKTKIRFFSSPSHKKRRKSKLWKYIHLHLLEREAQLILRSFSSPFFSSIYCLIFIYRILPKEIETRKLKKWIKVMINFY